MYLTQNIVILISAVLSLKPYIVVDSEYIDAPQYIGKISLIITNSAMVIIRHAMKYLTAYLVLFSR